MAGAFRAARSTKCDSHARWLHCLVRLRITMMTNGFRNRWIGFGLGLHVLDGFRFVLLRQARNTIAWAWSWFGDNFGLGIYSFGLMANVGRKFGTVRSYYFCGLMEKAAQPRTGNGVACGQYRSRLSGDIIRLSGVCFLFVQFRVIRGQKSLVRELSEYVSNVSRYFVSVVSMAK